MLEQFKQWLSENPDLKSVFYGGEIVICILFAFLIWLLKPKPTESHFKVREADLKKVNKKNLNPQRPDLLAQARIQRVEPLKLAGISLQGLPHEILGISPQASPDEIQKAYRDLMKQYHPDKLGALGGASQNQLGKDSWNWKDAQKIAEAINNAKDEMLKKARS